MHLVETKYQDKYGNNVKSVIQIEEVLKNNVPENFIVQNSNYHYVIQIESINSKNIIDYKRH